MDNNRRKALAMWSSMDGFWNLVKNKEEINCVWQTMYACVEHMESMYDSYGKFALTNMPESAAIKNVVLPISETNGNSEILDVPDNIYQLTKSPVIVSIPLLLVEINGATEYIEGVDYTISFSELGVLTVLWAVAPPESDETYFAPTVYIENPGIDKFGGMYWDMSLRSVVPEVARRKAIYHSLMQSTRVHPGHNNVADTLNMITGADYAKYMGKIVVSGEVIGISYVNSLYLVRHAGNVYGSEAEQTESALAIDGSIMTGVVSALNPCSVIEIHNITVMVTFVNTDGSYRINAELAPGIYQITYDSGKTYLDVLIARDTIMSSPQKLIVGTTAIITKATAIVMPHDLAIPSYVLDIVLPSASYDALTYDVIPLLLNDCYALSGYNVYSCYYDPLPNSGPYNVLSALNYDRTTGIVLEGETFGFVPGAAVFAHGDYVRMYAVINPNTSIYDWKIMGETGSEEPSFLCDDRIALDYLQSPNDWYFVNDTVSDHGLAPGDSLIMRVGYYMEYPATSPADNTISLKGTFAIDDGVLDLYGDPIPVEVNFRDMESIVAINAGGDSCILTIESGSYDSETDLFTLTTIEPIANSPITAIRQAFTVSHKHFVLEVDEITQEIITDRTSLYGEYASRYQVMGRRCRDENYTTHKYTITEATVVVAGTIDLTVDGGANVLSADTPYLEGSTTAIVWASNMKVLPLPVATIDAGTQVIRVVWDDQVTPAEIVGASLIYASNLYARSTVYLVTDESDPDVIALMRIVAGYAFPEGTTIVIYTNI